MKTITIKTRYIGSIHTDLGKNEDRFTMKEKARVKSLLYSIIERYGDDISPIIFDTAKNLNILITRNNALVSEDITLEDGDEVMLIPKISGG